MRAQVYCNFPREVRLGGLGSEGLTIDIFHGGKGGGVAGPPSILAGYLLSQKMEDFHG